LLLIGHIVPPFDIRTTFVKPYALAMISMLRLVVGAVMGFLVVMTLVLWFVLDDDGGLPDLVWLAVVAATAVAMTAAVTTLGYRTPALAPGTPGDQAARTARTAFQAGTMLRMSLAEAPAIVALALAFVVETGGFALYLFGAAVSLVLLAFHAMPSAGTVGRTEASLDREGGRSDLARVLA
jgi:hypothetical protein